MRTGTGRLLLFAAAALLASAPASGEEAGDGLVTRFGIGFRPIDATLSRTRRSVEIGNPHRPTRPPRYYRLRVKVHNPARAAWTLVVRSPAGQVLSTFDQRESACEEAAGCWTTRLGASLPRVQFETASDAVRAEIVDGLYMPAEVETPFYSPMPGSRKEPLSGIASSSPDETRALFDRADALGLFIGAGPTADGAALASWCCSGVRLTRDLFMTNWHCGAADGMGESAFWKTGEAGRTCRSGIVDLSWDGDEVGRELSCRRVEYADRDLDVAVLRLGRLADGPEPAEPLRRLRLAGAPARAGEEIEILHHPACEPKSVTRGCTVLNPAAPGWTDRTGAAEFTHNCTTERGSSGGPVFSGETLVGLHHLGADAAREPGNFAVGLPAILEALRQEAPALRDEILAGQD